MYMVDQIQILKSCIKLAYQYIMLFVKYQERLFTY